MRGSPPAPVRALSTYSLSQPRHSMARMRSTRPCVQVFRSLNSPTRMAYDASSFNGDLNSERCKGPSLTRTVYGASSFNGDLNKWGVAKVTVQRTWFMVPCPSTVTSKRSCRKDARSEAAAELLEAKLPQRCSKRSCRKGARSEAAAKMLEAKLSQRCSKQSGRKDARSETGVGERRKAAKMLEAKLPSMSAERLQRWSRRSCR
jgi:hypothetical protein